MAGEDIIGMSLRELRRLQVVHGALEGRFTQKAAAGLIGVSERQFRRMVRSVRENGDGGIVHGGRGRPSNRRFPEAVMERVLRLYRKEYDGFGPTLAAEKLLERAGLEAIAVGYGLRYLDDLENLHHQFELYDALYAWCRLETAKA